MHCRIGKNKDEYFFFGTSGEYQDFLNRCKYLD